MTPTGETLQALDERFMAAAIRYSMRHGGLTRTNPAVGTLIVRDDGEGPRIVGRGVTAVGGRPHAETEALAEAGAAARGATAYVTLEPCAHHGKTPPCAQALVDAGIARVVGGANDPDPRVAGKGYAMLREAGVEVVAGVLAQKAADAMAGYLIRSLNKRPEVILKLAVSADGMIGRRGEGQVAITGEVARAQTHLLRSTCDAILVGIGTVLADDPQLTVRLAGLEDRSPVRIVLDPNLLLPFTSRLAATSRQPPVMLAAPTDTDTDRKRLLSEIGVGFLAAEVVDGRVALPELMEDLGSMGMSRILVEGGAATARSFLKEGLVDRIVLFEGALSVGGDAIASPVTADSVPEGFRLMGEATFGEDRWREYGRHA